MIARRTLVAAGPLALAACRRSRRKFFTNTRPPSRQRLVYLNRDEPYTLDPALTSMTKEVNITRSLFEGLTSNDPVTLAPRAALATHCEFRARETLITFYLRGSVHPRGMPLPGAEQWPAGKPALWSDGSPVTAHDFVYSWRRFIDPRTAAPFATYMYPVKNAEAISGGGSLSAKDLAVEALDDFTFRVELRSPVPFFLNLVAAGALAAVPRKAIEAARQSGTESSWTQPGRVVVSGPFRLHEWRPYERIVLRRNPSYYNAAAVRLEELCFIPVSDGVTNVNLFKAGEGDSMSDSVLPSQFLPALEGSEELQVGPALDSFFYGVSVKKPPFDNPLLRYALNMAIDKQAVASVLGAGRPAAATYVPPMPGYRSPERLLVPFPGGNCDVLSYDPASARELLAAAGFPKGLRPNGQRFHMNFGYWFRAMSRERSEIVQHAWRRNLGIETSLAGFEPSVIPQILGSHSYEGVMEVDWQADYADPDAFLAVFTSRSSTNPCGWRDEAYDAELAAANLELDPSSRMRKLSRCEERLLRGMPLLPLFFEKWAYLQKPFVRGLQIDPLAGVSFQSTWIDTNWRPQ